MAKTKTVTVEITPAGDVTVQTSGFAGATCLAETQALQAALGTVTGDQKTPEFYQAAAQARTQQAKAGQ